MIFLLVYESSSKKQTVQRFKFSFKKHIHKIKQTSIQSQYPIYSVGGATKKQMSRIRLSAIPPDEWHLTLRYSIISGTAFTRPMPNRVGETIKQRTTTSISDASTLSTQLRQLMSHKKSITSDRRH